MELYFYVKGDWIHDQRQGHGEMQFADGSLYDVKFENKNPLENSPFISYLLDYLMKKPVNIFSLIFRRDKFFLQV